jgi:hypothetical protein
MQIVVAAAHLATRISDEPSYLLANDKFDMKHAKIEARATWPTQSRPAN